MSIICTFAAKNFKEKNDVPEKLDQHLLDALEEFGFETPTKVQKQSISKIKSGVDLMIRADEKAEGHQLSLSV